MVRRSDELQARQPSAFVRRLQETPSFKFAPQHTRWVISQPAHLLNPGYLDRLRPSSGYRYKAGTDHLAAQMGDRLWTSLICSVRLDVLVPRER